MSVRVHDKILNWDDDIKTFAHKLRVLQHACTALPWVVNCHMIEVALLCHFKCYIINKGRNQGERSTTPSQSSCPG